MITIKVFSGLLLFAFTIGVNAACPAAPEPNQQSIKQFLASKCYEQSGWVTGDRHYSGAMNDGTDYRLHGWITVSHSSDLNDWLSGPKPKVTRPKGGTLVVTEFESEQSEVVVAHYVKVSTWDNSSPEAQPFGGWFWSEIDYKVGSSSGETSNPACISCHASANNDSMVFYGSESSGAGFPDADFKWISNVPPSTRKLVEPAKVPDQEFVNWFELEDIVKNHPEIVKFPPRALDHAPAKIHGDELSPWVTSGQCMACHSANQLVDNRQPNMLHPELRPDEMLPQGGQSPDAKANRNFSQYGEWSASLNALSGRDPVWHAQVEAERKLRPQIKDFTNDVCFKCHGPMAGRSLKADMGEDALFTIDMFFDTEGEYARYGALARDGVSCAVCHQLTHPKLGDDPPLMKDFKEPTGQQCSYTLPEDVYSYTASFAEPPTDQFDPDRAFWGPWESVRANPMRRVLGSNGAHGFAPEQGESPQISESKLCGSCHVVLVPALPVGAFSDPDKPQVVPDPATTPIKLSFEQITYWEWRNSSYQNEVEPAEGVSHAPITCQGCHMNSHDHSKPPSEQTVANAERMVNAMSSRFPPAPGAPPAAQNTFNKRDGIARHILLGINTFVFEMYEQFPDILGTGRIDDIPEGTVDPTINARDWIDNHAERASSDTRITKVLENGSNLEVHVEVTNLAGHKLPSGAGFRRAFLDFQVSDKSGTALWRSGGTNDIGVLLDGETGQPLASELSTSRITSQKHHQIITSQDQVQVYETQALDSNGDIQSNVLGIYYEYKDNRILPMGWVGSEEASENTKGQGRNLFAMWPKLVASPADQPVGVQLKPSSGFNAPVEATEHELEECHAPIPAPLPQVVYDPDYWENSEDGKDRIIYRVPLKDIKGYRDVRVALRYQSIPPPFLGTRLQRGVEDKERGDAEIRLAHIASRLTLRDKNANWSLQLGDEAVATKAQDGSFTGVKQALTVQDVVNWGKAHYPFYPTANNVATQEAQPQKAESQHVPSKGVQGTQTRRDQSAH